MNRTLVLALLGLAGVILAWGTGRAQSGGSGKSGIIKSKITPINPIGGKTKIIDPKIIRIIDPKKVVINPGDKGKPVLNLDKANFGNLNGKIVNPKLNPGFLGGGKILTDQQKKKLQHVMYKKDLSPEEKSALGKVLSGTQLTGGDRQTLSGLLATDRGLTPDQRDILNQAMQVDMATHDRKYVRVHNATPEPLRVWVQYHTFTDQDEWLWFPVNPDEAATGLEFELPPGQTVNVQDEQWRINASRIRIWAKSSSGRAWHTYKTRDCWLVPENDAGERLYQAADMGVFTFAFREATTPVAGQTK